MYACPNIASNGHHRAGGPVDAGFMRAPAETPYFFALESAMDELAVALGMDPVELRRINDTKREPIKGLPYTSRALMPCFDAAAEAFGWSKRDAQPGSMRDGDWLVGWGCATSAYPTHIGGGRGARLAVPGRHGAGRDCRPRDRQRRSTPCWRRRRRSGWACRSTGDGAARRHATCRRPRRGRIDITATRERLLKACEESAPLAQAAVARRPSRARPRDAGWPTARCGADVMAAAEGGPRMGAVEEYAEWAPARRARRARMEKLYQGAAQPTGGGQAARIAIQFAFGAQFVEVRVHARTARDPRAPHRRRLRLRPHHEHPHGPQPVHGRDDLGHRLGAARGDRDRPARRPLRQRRTSPITSSR